MISPHDRVCNVGQDEVTVQTWSAVKYYAFNGQWVAMRSCGGSECGEAVYLHGDHLGSVSLATDHNGNLVAQARYAPYGQVRWNGETAMPTKFAFTGQRQDGFGLMDYNARFYSPRMGRFISADTFVMNPSSAMDFDRYMYSVGNPLRYTDPTGHGYCDSPYADPEECEYHDRADLPDEDCAIDPVCNAAYLTYNDLIWQLGRIPEPSEILFMTAYGEYFPYIYVGTAQSMGGGIGLRAIGQEALSRNWYEACGTDDAICTDNQLYQFMKGYEVWWRQD